MLTVLDNSTTNHCNYTKFYRRVWQKTNLKSNNNRHIQKQSPGVTLWKKHFLTFFKHFLQNSQKGTSVGVSFLINWKSETYNFIKIETSTREFSCEFCEISTGYVTRIVSFRGEFYPWVEFAAVSGHSGLRPPPNFLTANFFFINDNKKKLKKCKVLKTEIQYRLHKLRFSITLNKTSNISHNQAKFNLYNRHQTTQWLCFSIAIIGKNII